VFGLDLGQDGLGRVRVADIARQRLDGAAGALAQPGRRALQRVGASAGDDDPMAGQQELLGARVADAGGAAADESDSRADGSLQRSQRLGRGSRLGLASPVWTPGANDESR
jgi:hypothetical protein